MICVAQELQGKWWHLLPNSAKQAQSARLELEMTETSLMTDKNARVTRCARSSNAASRLPWPILAQVTKAKGLSAPLTGNAGTFQ